MKATGHAMDFRYASKILVVCGFGVLGLSGYRTVAPPNSLEPLAKGKSELSDFFNVNRGVLIIKATDFSNDQGRTRWAWRLCNKQLEADKKILELDFRQTDDGGMPECGDATCSTPGWEFGPSTTYYFSKVDHRIYLESIVLRSAPSLPGDDLDQERFVARIRNDKNAAKCGFEFRSD